MNASPVYPMTAVKSFNHRRLYRKERDVYLRLREKAVEDVNGFTVPKLIDFDNNLSIIEMTIVMPPCVLDFAAADLDYKRNNFPPEIMAEWVVEKQEQFEDDWETVQTVIWGLQQVGVYLNDVHPGNIMCR